MRIESNANFSVTLSKQGTHYQHLNKSSSSAFRPALPNLWLLLVYMRDNLNQNLLHLIPRCPIYVNHIKVTCTILNKQASQHQQQYMHKLSTYLVNCFFPAVPTKRRLKHQIRGLGCNTLSLQCHLYVQ